MKKKILLIEPNYKNKYPPMGLMKIATYYRNKGCDVRFFKGDLLDFASKLLCEEYLIEVDNKDLGKYFFQIVEYIKTGKTDQFNAIDGFEDTNERFILTRYRSRYKSKRFTKFDKVCITTLFTFYWKETIETINIAKYFCDIDDLIVGGIAASILNNEIYLETKVKPIVGLLNKPGMLDKGDKTIIDELPLDYSILNEIDYVYPACDAYFAYTTRGCVRKCEFCAVPRLEPQFLEYIDIKKNISQIKARFGPQKDLLLLDNNVLASRSFDMIIDDIKECGFQRGATYVPENEYLIAINNLKAGYNDRAYIKKIINIYNNISEKLPETEQGRLYLERERVNCIYAETATKESLLELDPYIQSLDQKFNLIRCSEKRRFVDFNQGVDARLINNKNMKKLSEINIHPLRIAFDNYGMRKTYEKAIRLAAKYGITYLSNYLLYNFKDKPEDLYYRMKLNVDLCEELDVRIYSFPMKYHPIDDANYFYNRDYIGKHWNRKFIRAIQSVLNSTKGKVSSGRSFFEEAFGPTIDDYFKILWMPEEFIIHRMEYKNNLTSEWWERFLNLSNDDRQRVESIIMNNKFTESILANETSEIKKVLEYYTIKYGSTDVKEVDSKQVRLTKYL